MPSGPVQRPHWRGSLSEKSQDECLGHSCSPHGNSAREVAVQEHARNTTSSSPSPSPSLPRIVLPPAGNATSTPSPSPTPTPSSTSQSSPTPVITRPGPSVPVPETTTESTTSTSDSSTSSPSIGGPTDSVSGTDIVPSTDSTTGTSSAYTTYPIPGHTHQYTSSSQPLAPSDTSLPVPTTASSVSSSTSTSSTRSQSTLLSSQPTAASSQSLVAHKRPVGAVVGGILGSLIILIAAIIGITYLKRARQKRRTPPSAEFLNGAKTPPFHRMESPFPAISSSQRPPSPTLFQYSDYPFVEEPPRS